MAHVYPTHKLVFRMSAKAAFGKMKWKRLSEQFTKGQVRNPWHTIDLMEKGMNYQTREVHFTFVAENDTELAHKIGACQQLMAYVWYATRYPIVGYEVFDWPSNVSVLAVGIARK